ncbi:uncharacterized protein LAESUDRAFT_311940 [Laetiporus sulphureus 93-53]|uniref:Uncharacterized protein n=1 Tax=Laetiporus sulphureus 93-53 TaxID=1314785 RepID=A0A165D4W4_9APHY|nr:uncharacterized protein LAESUDRAFT_311940 [Laetiporus sulphureus 93-53]KZT04158.1 hypothetical protein LAESUDRAFT_311940 [Laetiporus sulphureus 93-53]
MAIAVDDKDSHFRHAPVRCGYGTEGYLRSAEELSLAGSVAVSVSYIDGWNHDDHVEEGDNKHYTISERVSVMSSVSGMFNTTRSSPRGITMINPRLEGSWHC